jgi:DNA-binding response OmpR family regulator
MDNTESPRKILIIDDDSDCRKLLIAWLSSQFQNIEFVEYDPLEQGVPDNDFDWSAFDVLLLDYNLQIDGVTGLNILQDNYDNLLFPKTIMLTGAGNEEIEVRAHQSGVSDYMRKEQLRKSELKEAIDNAFAQQTSRRQQLYALNNAMQVPEAESQEIIEDYKKKYKQMHEQEVEKFQSDKQKIQQELKNSQAALAVLEQVQKNTDVEKNKLLTMIRDLNAQQSTTSEEAETSEEADIKTKLDTTQDILLHGSAEIEDVKQSIADANFAIEKTIWKEDKGATAQLEVENELNIVMEDKNQPSEAGKDMRERLELYLERETGKKTFNSNSQNLLDDLAVQLDKKDE